MAKLTESEQLSMCSHIAYEANQFIACNNLIHVVTDVTNPIHDALVVGYLIHLRNLSDFLARPTTAQDEDVAAQDFFDGGPSEWANHFDLATFEQGAGRTVPVR